MRMLVPSRSKRLVGTLVGLVVVLVASASPALALDFTFGEATKAYPESDPALVPISITYDCEEFLTESDDAAIAVTATAGTAGVEDSSFTPTKPPACTPGAEQTFRTNVTLTADKGVKAGDSIDVTVTVTPPGGEDVAKDTQVVVGPFVDVVFQANATTLDIAAGDSMDETVMIVSSSNDQVMVMPSLSEYPDGWVAPSLSNPMVEPNPGASANGELMFTVAVPSDAEEGAYNVVLSLFAHSTSEASVATDPVELAYTVNVMPKGSTGDGGGGDETEDAPAPVAPLAVTLTLVALAVLRRRD